MRGRPENENRCVRLETASSPWRAWIVLLWLACIGVALWPQTSKAQDADCAEVKIVIEQKLSL